MLTTGIHYTSHLSMLPAGTRIDDRYEVLGLLGAGGMGQVYRARRIRLGDEVAVKVLPGAQEAPADLHERFLRESQACAQLRHPSIVGLLDYGVDAARQPYMVMELLSGPSLAEEITIEAPMPPARVAGVILPVAGALQLAHDHGITHRDLKPANIVLHRYGSGERVYKVIDFGLAVMKSNSHATRLTDPNLFIGTMAYAAPEQIRGEPITAAADIYALGVIVYEMLTGVRPFETDDRFTLMNQVLTIRPVKPTARHPALPPAMDEVVLRALAKDPAERWPSIAAFAQALDTAVGAVRTAGAPAAAEDGLLSRYEMGAPLGRGRLGSLVYKGTHRALGTPVAIRVLRREGQPHWDAVRARFLLEGRTLQAAHPSLLQVRDFGEDERSVFVVTDLIEGPSLSQALAEGAPFVWSRVQALLAQALDAVAVLHRRGGFIAGVSPDMIRLTAEDGSERLVLSTAGIRSVQDVLATMREQELRGQEASEQELPYVAPEILMGQAPDPRADVFTVGVLAYQMATGRLPYRARSMPELLGCMLQAAPVPAAEVNAEVPRPASDAITRALAGHASARFASARELAAALR
ncbi:MAG: serine/threonine protein kinase [Acidobacteria bacterium]|nr:serine/threonine protein kinase [Acidobacteriota bacterium]